MGIKKIIMTLAAAAVIIPGSVAASVSSGTSAGGNATTVETSDDGLTTVTASARYTGALVGGGLQLVIECDAVGVGAVASTGIEDCYAIVDGRRYSAAEPNLPGNAAASTATFNVPLAPITVCVSGRAVPVLGDDAFGQACVSSTVIGDIDLGDVSDVIAPLVKR